jgi:hypothetical protein
MTHNSPKHICGVTSNSAVDRSKSEQLLIMYTMRLVWQKEIPTKKENTSLEEK